MNKAEENPRPPMYHHRARGEPEVRGCRLWNIVLQAHGPDEDSP
jgi:hypothetical protein